MDEQNNDTESLGDIREVLEVNSDSDSETELKTETGVLEAWKVKPTALEDEPADLRRLSKMVKSNTSVLEVSILLCHLYMCVTAAWSNNINLICWIDMTYSDYQRMEKMGKKKRSGKGNRQERKGEGERRKRKRT